MWLLFLGTHMRRSIKMLLLILMLLLAVASVAIITTLLILEWPRAANGSAGFSSQRHST